MEQHLKFSIGTTFNGEGFDKLSNAAKSSAGKVRTVTAAASDLVTQIGGMDRETNSLVKTGAKLVSSFLSMGVWGAAIAAVTSLIGWMKKLTDSTKEARLAAKGLSSEYMTLEAQAKGYQKRVEAWKNQAKEAAAAEKRAADEKAAADKAAVANAEKLQKLLDKQAETKEKIASLDESSKSGAAKLDVSNAERKLIYEQSFGDKYSQGMAQAELDLAKAKLQKAIEEEAAEREKNAQQEREQRAANKQKFEEMRESMEEEIRQREISNQERQLENAQRQAEAASASVQQAERNLQSAIEAYKDNMAQNEVTRSIGISSANAMNPGLTNFWGDLIKNRGLIQNEAADVAVERGLANGTIRTVEQMRKARNAATRAANDAIDSKETSQWINDSQRAARIQKMMDNGHGKAVSKADKEFLDNFKKIRDAREKAENDIKKREEELKKAKDAEKMALKDISEIRKKLDKLGLK